MRSEAWKKWANSLKKNTYTLYLASRHPQVPLLAKIFIVFLIAYALSPIDLIPDFIPVIGYLDDMLLLPLGIWLAIKLIPSDVWRECQEVAVKQLNEMPKNYTAAAIIVFIWIFFIIAVVAWLWTFMAGAEST